MLLSGSVIPWVGAAKRRDGAQGDMTSAIVVIPCGGAFRGEVVLRMTHLSGALPFRGSAPPGGVTFRVESSPIPDGPFSGTGAGVGEGKDEGCELYSSGGPKSSRTFPDKPAL